MADFTTEYETITDAIHTALTQTTDPNVVKSLMAEYDCATSSYHIALDGSIVSSAATCDSLTEQLDSATADIDSANQEAQNIANLLDKIGTAVGILAKIASLVK